MTNLKEELEKYGEVTSPVYVYLYEDGSAVRGRVLRGRGPAGDN